jgi:2-oxo-3-hexenedioate decarboxylase
MSNSADFIADFAQRLDQAALEAKAISQLSLEEEFNLGQAYEIQKASMQHRFNRGEKLVGFKMGFTSRAKMEQMGVHDLIWGHLTDAMLVESGASINASNYIHPRAEPEICFMISKTISSEISLEACRDHVSAVAAAIEVIDSRYENFKFSLEDVIADNCSSTAFAVGEWLPVQDLTDLQIELGINKEVIKEGSSNAILGDPWQSLQEASRLITSYGVEIPAGSYLMAGAATAAEFLQPGQKVSTKVEKLGSVEFNFQ